MNKNSLALIAGLLGGLASHYISPATVFAQTKAPVTMEVRAQTFTLVDPSGRTAGTFSTESIAGRRPGSSRIVLRNSDGREIWSACGSEIRPAEER